MQKNRTASEIVATIVVDSTTPVYAPIDADDPLETYRAAYKIIKARLDEIGKDARKLQEVIDGK